MDDPEGDMLTYLCKPRPWANKIVAIAQRQDVRLAFHSEQYDHLEMEARSDFERAKDHVHEDGSPDLSGQCVLPSICIA